MTGEVDPDEPFGALQFAKGATKRCALCGSVRRNAETVVADGRRICKSRVDCEKLKAHAVAQADLYARTQTKKLPEPTKAETIAAPRFWNQAGLDPV